MSEPSAAENKMDVDSVTEPHARCKLTRAALTDKQGAKLSDVCFNCKRFGGHSLVVDHPEGDAVAAEHNKPDLTDPRARKRQRRVTVVGMVLPEPKSAASAGDQAQASEAKSVAPEPGPLVPWSVAIDLSPADMDTDGEDGEDWGARVLQREQHCLNLINAKRQAIGRRKGVTPLPVEWLYLRVSGRALTVSAMDVAHGETVYATSEMAEMSPWYQGVPVTVGRLVVVPTSFISGNGQVWVLGCHTEGQTAVLKIESGRPPQIPNERKVLEALGALPGVPRVLACACGEDPKIVLAPHGHDIRHLKLSRAQVVQVCLQVVDILESVHKRGFVHGDVSPDNIIIFQDEPYLIDWGGAAELGAPGVMYKPRFARRCRVPGSMDPLSVADDFEALLHTRDYLLGRSRREYGRAATADSRSTRASLSNI